jgi:hypothetical protein
MSEGKERPKTERRQHADKANHVSHRSEENRCRTAGAVGEGQGSKEVGLSQPSPVGLLGSDHEYQRPYFQRQGH